VGIKSLPLYQFIMTSKKYKKIIKKKYSNDYMERVETEDWVLDIKKREAKEKANKK